MDAYTNPTTAPVGESPAAKLIDYIGVWRSWSTHWILIPAFVGSSPTTSAKDIHCFHKTFLNFKRPSKIGHHRLAAELESCGGLCQVPIRGCYL